MLHLALKHGFRLNRSIGFALLFYEIIAVLYAPEFWPQVRGGVAIFLTLAFLGLNEIALRALKRFPRWEHMDNVVLEKFSLLIPVAVGGFITLVYLLLGQVSVYLFLMFAVLESQLYGHQRLARVMMSAMVAVLALSIPLGYPRIFGEITTQPGVVLVMMLFPFLLVLAQFGKMTSTVVRSTTDRAQKLQSLAATDGLTGLINRRQFNHQLHSEISRAQRHQKPLSLALFDIDDFKKLNDFYGHQLGDRVLKELGQLVTNNVRESDIPARYGGEEFALILTETSQYEAYEILERLRALIEHTVFCLPDNPLTITISVGVAELGPQAKTAFELVELSDAALYEAKKRGKNQVVYGIVPTPKIDLHQMYKH